LILANEATYYKNLEKIITNGDTEAFIQSRYIINSKDVTYLHNEKILSSQHKSKIKDQNSQVYFAEKFNYSIDEEIIKGEKFLIIANYNLPKSDKFFLEDGIINLKDKTFIAKDTKIKIHKDIFDNTENDPRIEGVSSKGDENITIINKGVFTSCKKNDTCPPWSIQSDIIKHDKIKKTLNYENAILKIYDFPVLYFPKFFHPDPTVERQSGILNPAIGDHDQLGDSIYLPYFYVISDEKDLTLKPRLFNDNKFVLQAEYRQETKNSLTIIDTSITTGHYSDKNNRADKDTRSHLFTNTFIDLGFEDFISSSLQVNYEKISNDTYLKLFNFIQSSLYEEGPSTLTSKIELDLAHDDYDFGSKFIMYESLGGSNSDRYTYVLPEYDFQKSFYLDDINGSFNFLSSGNYTLNNTNVSETTVNNNLNYVSFKFYTDKGIATDYEILVKNLNSMSDNSVKYKNSPQSEIMSSYFYNVSLPLQKITKNRQNTLTPKLNFRMNPHEMKTHTNTGRRVDIGNVFSTSRLDMEDSFEAGESMTLGLDFKKEKINQVSKIVEIEGVKIDHANLTDSEIEKKLKGVSDFKKETVEEIEEYFDFKLATVFRFNKEENIPINSTLNEKSSNVFGIVNYKPIKDLKLTYEFSLTNDFNTIEYNSIGAKYTTDHFSTEFNFLEETGIVGEHNSIFNETKLVNFKDYHNLSFSTSRNRKINLTEYYDIIYEYKNDCLTAGIKYRKDYYIDSDIIPKEELFFSLTIVPFYTFSPDKMILNKDRID